MAPIDPKPDWLTDLDGECDRVRAALREHLDGVLDLSMSRVTENSQLTMVLLEFRLLEVVAIEPGGSVQSEVRRLLESLLESLPARKAYL